MKKPPSNLSAKWLLFEAGAISKLKNSGTACLLCAGVEDTAITGPLQQFQFQRFEKEPFFKLVRDMNQRTSTPLFDDALTLILEKWWSEIEKEYKSAVEKFSSLEKEQKDPRDEREFQDEILKTLRGLVNRPSVVEYTDSEGRAIEEVKSSAQFSIPEKSLSTARKFLQMTKLQFEQVTNGDKVDFYIYGNVHEIKQTLSRLSAAGLLL